MERDFTEVQKLVALKRYESPSDEYFEDFLDEFHRRQRADLMNRSARSLFFERVTVWFRELGAVKYDYGAGLAYAALMLAFFAWPRGGVEQNVTGSGGGELELPGNRVLEHVEFETVKKEEPPLVSPRGEF